MTNIKVALTNLGQYNEGHLNYVWLDLPATEEEIEEAMKEIGIGSKRWDGGEYEEYFISDYEAPFSIGEYSDVWQLSDSLSDLDNAGLLDDIINLYEDMTDINTLINLAHQSDNEELVQDIISTDELDDIVAHQAHAYGWERVFYLLRGIEWMNEDYYTFNGYGNIENLTSDYIESMADDVIGNILSDYGFNA